MKDTEQYHLIRTWLVVVAVVLLATGVATWLGSLAPGGSTERERSTQPQRASASDVPHEGVWLTIESQDGSLVRPLPAPSLSVMSGESLDMGVSPGPVVAAMHIPVDPGYVQRARFGIVFSGCSVSLELEGIELVPVTGFASSETELWSEEVQIPGKPPTLICRFESTGAPMHVRVLWQPATADTGHLVPVDPSRWPAEMRSAQGLALVQSHRCAACHVSRDSSLQRVLLPAAGPRLDDAGAMFQPRWIREWITDPSAFRSDASMPAVFSDLPDDREVIEDLVHFLAAKGGPLTEQAREWHPRLGEHGLHTYFTVGCVACHGDPGGSKETGFVSLGDQSAKTTVTALALFLRDPVARHPGGRMPGMGLSGLEADGLAVYLFGEEPASKHDPFEPDPIRVARGAAAFVDRGCASCHTINGVVDQPSPLPALSFESIAKSAEGGCLSEDDDSVVRYGLTGRQRRSIGLFLGEVAQAKAGVASHTRFVASVNRLNCLSCHVMNSEGGPSSGIDSYFRSANSADQTDEGRLPPPLTDAGARLSHSGLTTALVDGHRVRPHLMTRMPDFAPAQMHDLAQLLQEVAGVTDEPTGTTDGSFAQIDTGRELVGVAWLNCIDCHGMGGRPSARLPGIDLAGAPGRLRRDYFHRWMLDPQLERPGTRMPELFVGGRSAALVFEDGDALAQINAIRAYLEDGARDAPDGYEQFGEVILETADDSLVLRSFLNEPKARVVACGLPSGINFAFDIERCGVVMAWAGPLLQVGGPLSGDGSSKTSPAFSPLWTQSDEPLLIIGAPMMGWQLGSDEARFEGYHLNPTGLPVFEFRLGSSADVELAVVVERVGDSQVLKRKFDVSTSAGDEIWVNPGGVDMLLVGEERVRPGAGARDLIPVEPDGDGVVRFELWVELPASE